MEALGEHDDRAYLQAHTMAPRPCLQRRCVRLWLAGADESCADGMLVFFGPNQRTYDADRETTGHRRQANCFRTNEKKVISLATSKCKDS